MFTNNLGIFKLGNDNKNRLLLGMSTRKWVCYSARAIWTEVQFSRGVLWEIVRKRLLMVCCRVIAHLRRPRPELDDTCGIVSCAHYVVSGHRNLVWPFHIAVL